MEIEIHTTTGTWTTYVDDQEFADEEPGAAAGSVGDRIKAGEAVEVSAAAGAGAPHARREMRMVVFNPGHVVAVEEARQLRFARGRARRPVRP
jgi:hypothetical protein